MNETRGTTEVRSRIGGAEQDLDAARRLFTEAERADGAPPVSDQAVLGARQGRRSLFSFETEAGADSGTEASTRAATGPVAVGILGEGELDLVVRPGDRGRGVGAAALAAMLPHAEGLVRAWSHGDNPAADALLEQQGFRPVRTLLRMRLKSSALPLTRQASGAVPLPDGYRAAGIDPSDRAQVAEWVRVNAAAFATHPEQGAVTAEDFATTTQEDWFDVDDLVLAYDAEGGPENPSGHLAGYAWVKTVRGDEVETELYVLGVHPDHARKGLGAALLQAAFARMAEHDPARVTLYVDGENERAVTLYEQNGFEVEKRSRQWLRD